MTRLTFVLAAMLSFMACTPVAAQDLQKGLVAAETGDYTTAIKEFRPLAEEGDARAQISLARMYHKGVGVLQDNVMAHMWYNLSAANGMKLAGENRDKLAKKMSNTAIEKAQAMARECMSSGYTKCGDLG